VSRSYTYKPELKKRQQRQRYDRKVVLADYEIEFIEMRLGPSIRLSV